MQTATVPYVFGVNTMRNPAECMLPYWQYQLDVYTLQKVSSNAWGRHVLGIAGRHVKLHPFRRVWGHASPVFFEKKRAALRMNLVGFGR